MFTWVIFPCHPVESTFEFLKPIFSPKMTILGLKIGFLGPFHLLQPNTIKY